MTTQPTARTFTSLYDFVTSGEVGDIFTDDDGKGRAIETLRITKVLDTADPNEPIETNTRRVLVSIVTTRHYGKQEFWGRSEKVYVSTGQDNHEIGASGGFIRRVFSMGNRIYAVGDKTPAPRFNAKKLRDLHAAARAAVGM